MNKTPRKGGKNPAKAADAARASSSRSRGKQKSEKSSIRSLLVAVDYSPPSMRALLFAEDLARALKARIVLAHVLDPLLAPGRLESANLRQLRNEALEEARAKLAQLASDGRSLENQVLSGVVHTSLAKHAKNMKADLIVMGSNGRTGVNRLVTGSNAEKLIRNATIPVLVVR